MVDKNLPILPAAVHFSPRHQMIGSTLKSSAALNPANKNGPQLSAACSEMEALFINYLFKEMRATINRSGFISGGRGEEIFTSLLDAERSRNISTAGGIGLATIMLEQLGGKADSQK